MKLITSFIILASGIACALFYLRKPPADVASLRTSSSGDRPWRRVGAAICIVLAVMFVVGVHAVDIPSHPKAYAAYWLVMLALVLWLCVLALRDLLYTRHLMGQWRTRQGRSEAVADTAHSPPKESES